MTVACLVVREKVKAAEEHFVINPDSVCTYYLCHFYTQVSRHERRISQIEQLNQMPLYPTEKIIWDENIVPTEYYSGEGLLIVNTVNVGTVLCLCCETL